MSDAVAVKPKRKWTRIERGIYRRGNVYYILYFVNSIRKCESTHCSNINYARDILGKRKIQLREQGEFNIRKSKKVIRLSEIVSDFLEYSKNRKKTYIRDTQLARHLLSFFGDNKYVNEIGLLAIEQYRNKRLLDKVTPATINREVAFLKASYNYAMKNEKVTKNPVSQVKMFRETNKILKILSEDEVKRLINSCPEYFKPIVITALLTGMRKSEILNLTWENIDLQSKTIQLSNTKNGKIRNIPICNELCLILTECKKWSDGKYVFCNSDKKPYSTHIRTMFLRACEKAGITDFRFHDLRHLAASFLVMAGVDILTVMEILGHQSVRMTQRYAHLSAPHKQSAVEQLGNKIKEILK